MTEGELSYEMVQKKIDFLKDMFEQYNDWRQEAQSALMMSALGGDEARLICSHEEVGILRSDRLKASGINADELAFVFTPVTRADFEQLASKSFSLLLEGLNIRGAYPRVTYNDYADSGVINELIAVVEVVFEQLRLKEDGSLAEMQDMVHKEAV